MNQSRVKRVISWAVQILLATSYVLAASGKLMSRPQWIEMFRHWGFPDKFYLVIGALELVGAIGLLIPRIAGYAAAGLILLMIGAALTNLIHGDRFQVLRPLIFMVFLTVVLYLRRPWASRQSS